METSRVRIVLSWAFAALAFDLFPLAVQADPFFITGSLNIPRSSHTAGLLTNGKVLVAGGFSDSGYAASAELYTPLTGTWSVTGSLNTPRTFHTMTVLTNGTALTAGGFSTAGTLGSAELYNPATGLWTNTGSMITPRSYHTAVLLPNGKVLVAGGLSNGVYLASAELFNPATGTWTATGSMINGRFVHSAVLLTNGKVLVSGGLTAGGVTASAEIYDPATGAWTATGPMTSPRSYQHPLTLLANGKVLTSGGIGAGTLYTAELFDPATGTWTATGPMSAQRYLHTALRLSNGKVLVIGGGFPGGILSSAELYDPATGTWSVTSSLNAERHLHTATLLSNDNVLVAGGTDVSGNVPSGELYFDPSSGWTAAGSMTSTRALHSMSVLPSGKVLVAGGHSGSAYLSNAELYDPKTKTWTATGSMGGARGYHSSIVLTNGRVLVAGGFNPGLIGTAELYNPATGTWTATGPLNRARGYHSVNLLANGKVLVAGGRTNAAMPQCELYDPATGTWSMTGSLATGRMLHSGSLLPNGKVLVAGGLNTSSTILSSAELYDPATGTWAAAGSMSVSRYYHRAVLLPNGKVLVTGGITSGGQALTSADLYNPATGTWAPTGPMGTPRFLHTLTLLSNGKVLAAGGHNGSVYLTSAEVYDPASGTWTPASSMSVPRAYHTATLLPNDEVLVAGAQNLSGMQSSAELYGPTLFDPKTPGPKSFTTVIYASTGTQLIPRYQSPSANYSINRRVDISPFYNSMDSGTWGFDASEVPINGILKVPSGTGPFPLALFVHGNHNPLDFSDEGYVYLCELLASWGILAGTIDANFLNGGNFGENGARGILHLEHVKQFEIWHTTPGHPLFGKVDFNNIMLVGHSRGGEGVGHASYYNTYAGSNPVSLDGSAGLGPYLYQLKATVGIAPTDSQYTPAEGPTQIRDNYLIIHGSRDGDVSDFQGYLTYDRAHPINPANPTQDAEGFKALLWSIGANHNWFNSTWDNEFFAQPTLTRAEQENVVKVYIGSMAQATLIGRPKFLAFLKNHELGKSWLPSGALFISQYQEAQRQFINHYEEDSNPVTLSPPTSGLNSWSASSLNEFFFNNFGDLYQETRGAQLSWSSPTHFYRSSFSGSGFNPGTRPYLAVRIGQSTDANNPFGADQNLRIIVQDTNGGSAAYHASAFPRLLYPDTWNVKMVMQTIRVPLNLLRSQGVNVNNISSIRLAFDQVSTGTVYFDELQTSN